VARAVPEPGPKPEPQPAEQVKPKPAVQAMPETKPELKRKPTSQVKPKPAALTTTPVTSPPPSPPREPVKAAQPKRQLTYEVETMRQAGEREKKQSFSAGEKVRFRRVIPQGTGRLQTNEKTIILADIEALDSRAQCKYASGKSWECGRWGKYALRRFIRGRAVVCNLTEEISGTEVKGRCTVAGSDINKWVVRRGWGKPSGDSTSLYDDALTAAKKDKLGLWSEAPKSTP